MSECRSDTCGPCHAGKHERCYEPCLCRDRGHPVETVTPSEKALARMLAEWLAWREVVGADTTPEAEAMRVLGQAFFARGMITTAPHEVAKRGRDLRARAKKAGVL